MTDESIPRRENGKGKAPGTGPRLACLRNCRGEAKGEEVETGQRQGAGQREEEAGQREEAGQANNEALSFCLKTLPFNFPEMKYNE